MYLLDVFGADLFPDTSETLGSAVKASSNSLSDVGSATAASVRSGNTSRDWELEMQDSTCSIGN